MTATITTEPKEPETADELAEVLVLMRAVLGDPERMESPKARAIFLLDQDRLAAANRGAVHLTATTGTETTT
jgi:hypothetical protein